MIIEGIIITAIICTTGLFMYISYLIYNSKCFKSQCCTDEAVLNIERHTKEEHHVKAPTLPIH